MDSIRKILLIDIVGAVKVIGIVFKLWRFFNVYFAFLWWNVEKYDVLDERYTKQLITYKGSKAGE